MIDLLMFFFGIPVAAFCMYTGWKLLTPSAQEYQELVDMQGSTYRYGIMENAPAIGNGDYKIRRGLDLSKDGERIVEQGAPSSSALRAAFKL